MDVEERAQSLSLWEQDLRQGVDGVELQAVPIDKSLDMTSNVDKVIVHDQNLLVAKDLPVGPNEEDVAPVQNNTAQPTENTADKLSYVKEPHVSDIELLHVQMEIIQELDREHEKNLR